MNLKVYTVNSFLADRSPY